MNLLLQAQGGGNMTFLVMMVAIFVIMWFFMIRPQQKSRRKSANSRTLCRKVLRLLLAVVFMAPLSVSTWSRIL